MSLTAFFLCAGYGKRLRPLTERIAKPAIPFLGQSAFEINVRQVDILKPNRRIANAHHLPEQIESLGRALNVEVLHEEEVLGTGGCLANAAHFLRETDHFLVHNADLIHTLDLEALYGRHLASGAMATLAGIHRDQAPNTLSVSTGGALLGVHGFNGFDGDSEEAHRLTFTGIAFYRRDFLAFVDAGCSDIKPYWLATLRGGGKIRVEDCSGAIWHDFGTPQGLWEAARFRMESTGTFAYRYPASPQTKPYVSNEATPLSNTVLPSDLENVLVYEQPQSSLPSGLRNAIIGRDFSWPVRTSKTT